MGGGVSTNHKSSNRIELSRLGQDWLNFYSFDLTQPIYPPIHPHPPMGGSVSKNHKSSNRTELSWLSQQFFKFLVIWPDPTHQPTHQTIHPPLGGEVSTDFKSSNRIEISRLVQVLLNFDWFRGSPLGGGGGEWWGDVPPHMHTHVHACMCMHIWHHREFPGIPLMGLPFAIEIIMFNVYMCMCMHVHVWGAPPTTPSPIHPPPSPELQGVQNTKIQ